MLPDTFQTAPLMLRPIAPEDADPIFDSYAQDPDVARFVTWRPHRSRNDTAAFIDLCLATPAAAARTYVLVDPQDRMIRGVFDLRRTAPHRLEFGYALARRWWGQGLMTEALIAVVHWALRQPEIFRIGA